jgi:hypothetical protein
MNVLAAFRLAPHEALDFCQKSALFFCWALSERGGKSLGQYVAREFIYATRNSSAWRTMDFPLHLEERCTGWELRQALNVPSTLGVLLQNGKWLDSDLTCTEQGIGEGTVLIVQEKVKIFKVHLSNGTVDVKLDTRLNVEQSLVYLRKRIGFKLPIGLKLHGKIVEEKTSLIDLDQTTEWELFGKVASK